VYGHEANKESNEEVTFFRENFLTKISLPWNIFLVAMKKVYEVDVLPVGQKGRNIQKEEGFCKSRQ